MVRIIINKENKTPVYFRIASKKYPTIKCKACTHSAAHYDHCFYQFFPQRRKIPFIIFAPFKLKPLHESFQIWRRISK